MKKNYTLLLICSTAMTFTACSFVKDRSDENVQIIEASEYEPNPEISNKKAKTYRVQENDTLGTIAAKTMGAPHLYLVLAEANQLDPNSPLLIGQLLIIPEEYSKNRPTYVQPLKRPRASSSNKASTASLKEVDTLIEEKRYNQAIDWLISHPQLGSDQELENKLMLATSHQVEIERSEKDYAEALFLLNGLLEKQSLSRANQAQLNKTIEMVSCDQASYNALQFINKQQTEQAYNELLKSYNKNANYSEQLTDFTAARSQTTEAMHQEALKLYRNQQLEPALAIWDKILAIKPSDDLALVYKDRVLNLQKKLDNL